LFGGLAAFIGFTLPSFLLMLALALLGSHWTNQPAALAIVTGLKLFALVVVADAILTMSKQFCRQQITLTIAIITAALLWLLPGIGMQFIALLGAAVAGMLLLKSIPHQTKAPLTIQWPFLGLFM